MVHRDTRKCLTMQQMKEWKEQGNQKELYRANQMAGACVLCKRIWMRFWASQK